MVPRLPNWRFRLDAVVLRYSDVPFQWGKTDCANWSADCVEAVTGVDVLGTLRGSWHSRLSCRARLLRRGWRSNREAAAGMGAAVGAVEIDPRAARFGDVGVTLDDAMAVKLQPGFVARDNEGRFRIVQVETAWKVGD